MKLSSIHPTANETSRFLLKRQRIVDAASDLINERGVKGMTFVDVARRVNLNTTSVTYYFKRKELLAAAALERSIERIGAMVAQAAAEPDPRSRVAGYLKLNFDLSARIRRGEDRPITVLSDIRALDEPLRSELGAAYAEVFRGIRAFFGPIRSDNEKALNTARAHVLVENIYWLPAWLWLYSISDFERVRYRFFELFDRGIGKRDAPWAPTLLNIEEAPETEGADRGRENFLRAATRLINERGYRGASVERIVSELNVTKGSFYHHLDAKDDLVLECFRRSYQRVSQVQRAAAQAGGSHWQQLCSAIATLLDTQFKGSFPLLRTTALQALPEEMRATVVRRSDRMARRFAGMLIDGLSEGSIHTIDPLIASQAIMAMLNAAYDLRGWAAAHPPERAVAWYASTLAYGLFSDPRPAASARRAPDRDR